MSNNGTNNETKLHCASCKPIFYLLASLGELPKEEIDKLENHKMVCPAGLEYSFRVSEIMSGLQYQPAETEISAMELLSTEVWHFKETKIVDRTLSELLENIELKDKQQEITDLIKSIPDPQQLIKEVDTLGNKVAKLEAAQTVIFKEIQSIKLTFLVVSLTVVSISILIFLVFGSTGFYKQSLVTVNSSDDTNLSKITNNSNLYEALDIALDNYLSGQSGIAEAENIVKQIKTQHNDNYGIDLVKYYKSVTLEQKSKLFLLRKELKTLTENTLRQVDTHENFLSRLDDLRQRFLLYGNLIEAYKAKILLFKYSILTAESVGLNNLFSDCLSWTTENEYLFLKLHVLLWKAKDQQEDNPQLLLENVIKLARQLNVKDAQISASASLSAIYVNDNNNHKALDLIDLTLQLSPIRYVHKVTLLQVKGMAYFNIKDYENARMNIQEAVNIAEENHDTFLVSLTQSFLGTVLSQSGQHREAEATLTKAFSIAETIKVPTYKFEIKSRIVGYQAKNSFLQGKYNKAANLYKESIDLLKASGISGQIEMAELNRSLALTLQRTGNKDYSRYEQVAAYLFTQVVTQKNSFNCTLSLMPICF